MARGGNIEIPIGVDAGGVEKSIQNGLIKPIENAEKALDKLADTDAGRDIDKAMDKAQDATKDLSKELDATRKDLDKLGFAAKDAGDDTRKSMDRAKEGVKEVGREAESTAKESAASFDGSAESIGDAFQEVAANAFAGFGPAGAAAGIAVAEGIGVGIAAFDNMGQQSEALKETVKKNFSEMADEGIAAWESVESQAQRLRDAYGENEDAINRIKDLIGLPFETVAAAWAGNADAIDVVNRAYGDMTDKLTGTMGISREAADATIDGWNRVLQPLTDTVEGYDKAKERAQMYADQVAKLGEEERGQIQRTRDASQAHYEAMADRYSKPLKVKVEVDDSAYRNWTPTVKFATVFAGAPKGVTWQ